MGDISTGNKKKIEIRCSNETRREWKRLCADLDPDLTYEQVLHEFIEEYNTNPRRFKPGGID